MMTGGLLRRLLAMCAWVAICANSGFAAASAQILSETATSLSMKFTDAGGAFTTINLTRPDTSQIWRHGASSVQGIIFGREDVAFASATFLNARDIDVKCSLMTFSTDIVSFPMSDITIYQLFDGDMAIGLWNYGRITHIVWVGDLVDNFYASMEGKLPPLGTACNWVLAACCGTLSTPGPGPTETTPIAPDVSACQIVAASCPEKKAAACVCLAGQCDDGDPDTNPGQPDNLAACMAQLESCQETPEPEPDPIELLLQEILERLEQLLRVLTCKAMGGIWSPEDQACIFPDPVIEPNCP